MSKDTRIRNNTSQSGTYQPKTSVLPRRYGTTKRMGRNANVAGGRAKIQLSSCGKAYIGSLVMPFSHLDSSQASSNAMLGAGGGIPATLPCVPTFPALKSRRLKIFGRGTTSASSDGDAQFLLAPRRAANDYGTTTDAGCPLLMTTGSNSYGSTFISADTGGANAAGIIGVNYNSDYGSTQTSAYVSERLVCAGLRIRYSGAELVMGGIIHCIEEPNHNSLSGQPLTSFNGFESYFRQAVSRDWTYLVYTPTQAGDYDYSPDFATGYDVTKGMAHYMGMMIIGSGAGSAWEYEFISILEVVGEQIRDLVPAKSDMKALEVAAAVIRPENQLTVNQPNGPATIFANAMKDVDFTTVVAGGLKVAKMLM